MKFTKMHGIGNDYVYVNCFEEKDQDWPSLAKKVSCRHFGVGSDGLILILPSAVADCRMRMFNADGTEGEMCGNGIRCVGKYVYDHHIVEGTDIQVETKAGIKKLFMEARDGKVFQVTVDLGAPQICSKVPEPIVVHGISRQFVGISLGNPHAVYHMEDIDALDLEKMGPFFECHSRFPERTNTEFIQVVDRGHIRMRVWERGSGETLACGTGAGASVVASALLGLTGEEAEVALLGGSLHISWDRKEGRLWMTGPATEVYQGELDESFFS